jgi:hypothetical protein
MLLDTRSSLDMDLGLYFLSPLEIEMSLRIFELYKFGFRKGKIRLN